MKQGKPALTSILSVLAAFAIIVIDLLGRAALDKVLALAADPATVALWAQLQSLLDLVSGVAATGILQGLTVTVAQARGAQEERSLLDIALRRGLLTALAAGLIVAIASPAISGWLTQGRIAPALVALAALSGWLAVVPATLNAYWLGRHQQQRMLGLACLLSLIWLTVALGAWEGLRIAGLALLQCATLFLIAGAIWTYLRHVLGPGTAAAQHPARVSALMRFVPVGLAIGVMSPLSLLLMRGLLSTMLGWDEVGYLQALWRASDWVTATAAGVLSLVFLPRLSAAYGTARFRAEMARAGLAVLIPAACLLLAVFLGQRQVLSALYDSRFAVSGQTAALFLAGCWIRIAAWIFLYGLFAAHRTRLIVAGEILSLPLLTLLLWAFRHGMTLERMAAIYLATYCVYLCFNAAALLYSRRGQAPH